MVSHNQVTDKTCLENDFRREKLWRFKKGKIFLFIYINSSVVNTDRPIISKTNCLKENLNDANRSFENNEEFSNAFQLDQKHRLQQVNLIGHLKVNALWNKFEAVKELVQNSVDIYQLSA